VENVESTRNRPRSCRPLTRFVRRASEPVARTPLGWHGCFSGVESPLLYVTPEKRPCAEGTGGARAAFQQGLALLRNTDDFAKSSNGTATSSPQNHRCHPRRSDTRHLDGLGGPSYMTPIQSLKTHTTAIQGPSDRGGSRHVEDSPRPVGNRRMDRPAQRGGIAAWPTAPKSVFSWQFQHNRGIMDLRNLEHSPGTPTTTSPWYDSWGRIGRRLGRACPARSLLAYQTNTPTMRLADDTPCPSARSGEPRTFPHKISERNLQVTR